MELASFALERYFARYEFSAKHLLSSSDCDGLPMSRVLSYADAECRELWDNLTLGYTESQGLPLLCREIASLYDGIAPEHILEVVPEEGIFVVMNAILRPGDHIVCTFPGYQSLYQIAQSTGCTVTKWQPDETQNWRFDPDVLRQSITHATKLFVINFPHNPTGSLASQQDFREILDIVKEHNLYIFSDEMYRYLEYEAADHLPSAVEVYDKAVTLFGMSKTFGMAGVRTGWLVTRDAALYETMAAFKDYTTICPPAPSEILALIGLRAKDTIIGANRATIEKNLVLVDAFFQRHADRFTWVPPKAGTIGLARLHGVDSSLNFCQQLVTEAGIMLLPSTVYGFGDRHVRIGFGRKNLPQVLDAFDAYLTSGG